MRLPVVLIVAVAVACALSGDVSARPIWAPTIDNPYCAMTNYVLPDLTEQAMSTTDADDHPVIVINGLTVRQEHAYAEFLMAHECCHHTLGHVAAVHRVLGQLGPQPFFYIAPQLKGMELEADCCAVKMLKQTGDIDARGRIIRPATSGRTISRTALPRISVPKSKALPAGQISAWRECTLFSGFAAYAPELAQLCDHRLVLD